MFIGQKNASVASSDLSTEALAALVERALAMAAEAPEDHYAGLAPEELLFRGEPADLDLDDGGDPDPAGCASGRWPPRMRPAPSKGVTNSNGGRRFGLGFDVRLRDQPWLCRRDPRDRLQLFGQRRRGRRARRCSATMPGTARAI